MAVTAEEARRELARRELDRRRSVPTEQASGPTTDELGIDLQSANDPTNLPVSGFFNAARGLGETALQIGSSALATPVAGIEGIVRGLRSGGKTGAEAVEDRLRALTFQPRTEQGQLISGTIADAAGAADTAATGLAAATGDPDDVLGATAIKTLMLGGPALLGLRNPAAATSRAAQPKPQRTVPQVDELFRAGREAFDSARRLGSDLKPEAMTNFGGRIASLKEKSGLPLRIDPDLHSGAYAVQQRILQSIDEGTLSFDRLLELRQLAGDVAKSLDRGDSRVGVRLLKEIDEFVDNLGPNDVVSGTPQVAAQLLKEGRDLWARARKAEEIERRIDIAQIKGKAQFTGAGREQALRAQFRQLAERIRNGKERGWTKDEIKAITRVAEGGPVGNIFRELGKNAPTGIVSSGIGAGVGFTLFGPAGAVAIPAAGLVGRKLATRATEANASNLLDMTKAGGLLSQ